MVYLIFTTIWVICTIINAGVIFAWCMDDVGRMSINKYYINALLSIIYGVGGPLALPMSIVFYTIGGKGFIFPFTEKSCIRAGITKEN